MSLSLKVNYLAYYRTMLFSVDNAVNNASYDKHHPCDV